MSDPVVNTPDDTGLASAVEALLARQSKQERDDAQAGQVEGDAPSASDADVPGSAASEQDSEQQETGAEESSPPPPTTRRVRVDGKEVEVPVADIQAAVDGLKRLGMDVTEEDVLKGFSFAAYNTRKSQAVSERLKEVEQTLAEARDAREKYSGQLATLSQIVEAQMEPYKGVDWDALAKSDPASYASHRAYFDQLKERLDAVRAEQSRIERERAEEMQKAFAAYLSEQHTKLLAMKPEWADDNRRAADLQAISEWANTELGFTNEELAQVADARVAMLFDMAYRYARAQHRAKDVRNRGQGKPPVAPRGGTAGQKGNQAQEQGLREKLRKSGKIEDAAALLLARHKGR